MFEKILIANRGEIALRVQRACREMGIRTVMVYSEGDKDAKYLRIADEAVCIGPPQTRDSYLNAASIIAAAEVTEADAIHPGYGLLSENANFAEQTAKSGFVFIGPTAEIIRLMGDKIAAKAAAKKYGLKTIPDSNGALPEDDAQAAAKVSAIGYPAVIKAAAGGGGRGMRVVSAEAQAQNVLPILRREAQAAFGNGALYAEKFLDNPRHVEVQVLADGKNAVHLGTRDCSLQRRYQKIIEEAPAPNIARKKLDSLCAACAQATRKMGYLGVGTFEFLWAEDDFYFIEMNTRLQVEHPVTEQITGIDLVAEQIRVAAGVPLALKQKDIVFSGHAVECRINAEDPRSFMPAPGLIVRYDPPGGLGVRVDSHIYSGYNVPPYYDSLIAKLVASADTRENAIARMASALREFAIEGIATNLPLHAQLMADKQFLRGGVGINHLAAWLEQKETNEA